MLYIFRIAKIGQKKHFLNKKCETWVNYGLTFDIEF